MRVSSVGLRRLVLEGLTIVAGILLAFGIDAWWDQRSAAEAERAMLVDLGEEFGMIERTLAGAGRAHGQHRAAAQLLLRGGEGVADHDLAVAVHALTGFVTLDISTGSLDAAVSGQAFGRIGSDSFRALLARWPGAYLDLAENEELEVQLMEHSYSPLLSRHLSLPGLGAFTGLDAQEWAPEALAVLDPPRDTVALMRSLRTLIGTNEFQGLVYQMMRNDASIAEEYDDMTNLLDSLKTGARISAEGPR